MFNPSHDQARRFFIDAWRKQGQGIPLTPMEHMAADIVSIHPEYHALLKDGEAALTREWMPEQGEANPFLHLSLHLAIEEQLSIDQPPGLRAIFDSLSAKLGERHPAVHVVLECLAETVWRAQRDSAPPDGTAYLDCLRKALDKAG